MLFVISCLFIIFNILMWIVFFARFKKLFSTENIIENTKSQMNEIVSDMNRNTFRNINLIDQKIKELKAAVAEVDRHMAVSRQETEKHNAGQNLQKQMDQLAPQNNNVQRNNFTQRVVDTYMQNSVRNSGVSDIQPETIVRPLDDDIMLTSTMEQMALNPNSTIVAPSGTQFTIQHDGASYASVPIVNPQVTYADNPVTVQTDFASQVKQLHQMGMDVSLIATKLNRTISEVQFVIDMSF